jgi:MFS family permease
MIQNRLRYTYFQIRNIIKPPQYVPEEHKRNFSHFYLDYAYFGILNGTLLAFLTVYMARLGASGVEIGLISALPAVVSLLFAIPAGKWLTRQPIQRGVFFSALLSRIFYIMLILVPFIVSDNIEIRLIILITLVMSVPATGLAIGANAIFAEAVPMHWRGYVSGVRNVLYALMTMLSTFIGGQILVKVPFPTGYQIVFLIGAFGAILSTYHLGKIKPITAGPGFSPGDITTSDKDLAGNFQGNIIDRIRNMTLSLNLHILGGKFGRTLFLLLLFHLFQYLAIPVMTFFQVNNLQMTDRVISIGNVSFFLTMLITSTQLSKMTTKIGSQKNTGLGVMILSLYPAGIVFSQNEYIFYLVSAIGGIGWGLSWGSLYNYLLEKVPVENKPPYLAWYNIVLSFSILIGAITGPMIAAKIGLEIALLIFASGRLLAGWLIFREG